MSSRKPIRVMRPSKLRSVAYAAFAAFRREPAVEQVEMRGFLKSREGIFRLSNKLTTVGKEGSDLVLQDGSGDRVGAVIEYVEQHSGFFLRDMNSFHGIYVNDCRIHNATVRLEPNDVICFSYNGIPYEFLLESSSSEAGADQETSMSRLPTASASRADGLAELLASLLPTGAGNFSSEYNLESSVDKSFGFGDEAGWISGPRVFDSVKKSSSRSSDGSTSGAVLSNGQIESILLELRRLQAVESDSSHKDDVIEQLRDEVTNLQNCVRQFEVGCCINCRYSRVGSGQPRLLQLETYPSALEAAASRSTLSDGSELSQIRLEFNKVHEELSRTQEELNVSMSLVCEMKRTMDGKDTTISWMAREMEAIKSKLAEREIEVDVLEASLQRVKENTDTENELNNKNREIALLQRKLKIAECRKQELSAQALSLTECLSQVQTDCEALKSVERRLKSEVQQLTARSQDLERAERIARVDVEQLSKRFEKLRSHVIQTMFAGASTKSPDKLLSDDELLAMLKKRSEEAFAAQKKPSSQQLLKVGNQ